MVPYIISSSFFFSFNIKDKEPVSPSVKDTATASQDLYADNHSHLSFDMRKLVFGVSARSDTNWPLQSQKQARGLKY